LKTPEKLPKTPEKTSKTPEKLAEKRTSLRETPENATATENYFRRFFFVPTFALEISWNGSRETPKYAGSREHY